MPADAQNPQSLPSDPATALSIALSQLDQNLSDAIALIETIKQLQLRVTADVLSDLSGSDLAGDIYLKSLELGWLEGPDFLG